jgi:hypothetical protein
VQFALRNIGLEALTAQIHGSVGDAVRFSDATRTVRGHFGGGITLRVLRRLNISMSGDIDRLGRPLEGVNQLILFRMRTVVGFTRWLSLRLIGQGRRSTRFAADGTIESLDQGLLLNALLRIEPSPGTAVLLGWGQQFATEDDKFVVRSIDLFAKASVLIRL